MSGGGDGERGEEERRGIFWEAWHGMDGWMAFSIPLGPFHPPGVLHGAFGASQAINLCLGMFSILDTTFLPLPH
jgi:hypothetical protein